MRKQSTAARGLVNQRLSQLFAIDRNQQQAILPCKMPCSGLLCLVPGREMNETVGQIDRSTLEFSACARILP